MSGSEAIIPVLIGFLIGVLVDSIVRKYLDGGN